MPLFEHLRKVDVRAVLRSLKCGGSATFQLRPREFVNGRWQGGTFLRAKRLTRRFLIGALVPMTMKEAVEYVHTAFDGYHTPRVKDEDHDPSVPTSSRGAQREHPDPRPAPKEAAGARGKWW